MAEERPARPGGAAAPTGVTGDGAGIAGAPAVRSLRFPAVTGRSLLGAEFRLPSDLPAERTLVVVAFQQWHQRVVDAWIERAVGSGLPATIRGATGRLRRAVVELPVLSSRWRPVRRFIDGGMTAGIANPDILARTITVYTDVGAFQAALGIRGSEDVHAFVVAPDGTILARGSGLPEETWDAVAESLAGAADPAG